jgi:aminomethyltransferase
LYRIGEDVFFMVVNASTEETDFEWITSKISKETIAENISAQTAKIDIQGPMSPRICARLLDKPINGLRYYHCMDTSFQGEKILLSRTGYTGEIGFEFYASAKCVERFWDECIALGAEPAGLGARDTLRLEMGYPLYGHELDAATSAAWSGLTKALGNKSFIGSHALCSPADAAYRLCALLIDGRRAAHTGATITSPHGETVGHITSGSFSPSLGQAIALGYVRRGYHASGTNVIIKTDRGELSAHIATSPLYTKATGRNDIEQYLT